MAEDISTTHLDTVPPADDSAETEAAEVTAAVDGFKLPKTLKAALEVLHEIQDTRPDSARAAAEKNQVMEKLRAHIHALSQGPMAPTIQGADHAEISGAHSTNAEEIHLVLLCRTDRIVADRLKRDAATIADLQKQVAALTAAQK